MIDPYYTDDLCTLYCGDCRDVLPQLGMFDIAVTSPPYNMGLIPGGNGRGMYKPGAGNKGGRYRDGYDGDSDGLPQGAYDTLHRSILVTTFDHVNKAVFYNHRPRIIHGLLTYPLGGDYGGLPLRQIIIWDRKTGIDVDLRHFCTRQESILLFASPEFTLVDHAASGMGDVWRMGMETAVIDHPAPFPVELPARCIAATGATSVLDPYVGSGTTLRAAKNTGVRAVGIEKSERYCEIAVRRLAQETLPLFPLPTGRTA